MLVFEIAHACKRCEFTFRGIAVAHSILIFLLNNSIMVYSALPIMHSTCEAEVNEENAPILDLERQKEALEKALEDLAWEIAREESRISFFAPDHFSMSRDRLSSKVDYYFTFVQKLARGGLQ